MIKKCRDWLDANYQRNLIPFLLVALIPAILVLGLERAVGLPDPNSPSYLLQAGASLMVWALSVKALLWWTRSHRPDTN